VRDDQLIVTRDRVADQATSERILVEMARRPLNAPKPSEAEEDDVCEEGEAAAEDVPLQTNMPVALFKQQMRAIEDLYISMPSQLDLEEEQSSALDDVTDKLEAVAV